MDISLIDKYLSLFFSLLIFSNAYLIKKMYNNWLFPACLYSLFWFGYTFFPLIFVSGVPIEPLSILYIYVSSLIFTVTTFFFPWSIALTRNKNKLPLNNTYNSTIKTSFFLLSILAFIFLLINSFIQGFSINDLIFNFFESSAAYAGKRGAEEITLNIFSQLSYVFGYGCLPLGGILISNPNTSKKEKFIVVFMAFLPIIFIMLTQSAKGAFFQGSSLFYGGILIAKIFSNNFDILSKSTLKFLFIAILIIVPLTIISFLSRGLYSEDSDFEFVMTALTFSFKSYAFGHLYAFSDWFSYFLGEFSSNQYLPESLTFGFYTFMPIFYIFGSTKKIPLGYYDEYLFYDQIIQTNIYTWYRGLINDFSLSGSFIFMFAFGCIFNFFFFTLLSKQKPTFSIAIYIFMIGFFYGSFGMSLLIWKSIYVSVLLLFIIFKLSNIKSSKK